MTPNTKPACRPKCRLAALDSSVPALAALLVLTLATPALRAQTAISSLTTTFTSGTASSVTLAGETVTSDNDTLGVDSFTAANGATYEATGTANSVIFRTNTSAGPNTITQWYMG